MEFFIRMRDLLISNFSVKIMTLQYKNLIIQNNILFFLLGFLPFTLLKFFFKFSQIKYIYYMDNLYFSNYTEVLKISPIFLSIKTDKDLSLIDNFKKYNYNIPIWFFLQNENLNNVNYLNIKYFQKGKVNEKNIDIKESKNKLLQDIF